MTTSVTEPKKAERPLGSKQQDVLEALRRHRLWCKNCGWVWDTPGGTQRVLKTLVTRGLVTMTIEDGWREVYRPVQAIAD